MNQRLEKLIEIVKTWPEARQADAAAMLEVMAENETGVYKLSAHERKSIESSRAQVRRGELASDDDVAKVLRKHGL